MQWSGMRPQKRENGQDEFSHDPSRRRILIVVSTKHGRSYEAVKSALGGRDDTAPFIDWVSNKVDDLPEPSSFIRHFALCIVSVDDWNNKSLMLMTKLRHGTFWELVGPDIIPREGDGVHWKEDKIKCIDGVMEIGHITYGNEDVSEQFYRPLRQAWSEYDIVW